MTDPDLWQSVIFGCPHWFINLLDNTCLACKLPVWENERGQISVMASPLPSLDMSVGGHFSMSWRDRLTAQEETPIFVETIQERLRF